MREQAAGRKTWLSLWQDYSDVLPETYCFLRDKVKSVAVLLTHSQPPMLLYTYGQGAKLFLYKGLPPISAVPEHASTSFWQCLPAKLRQFYTQTHNGWVQYASDAIGPLPLEQVYALSDPDFDVSAEIENQLPFKVEDVYAIFSNGGGDYLAIDCDKAQYSYANGVIWWHEKPLESERNLDFWTYMDGWISGQVEDMDNA